MAKTLTLLREPSEDFGTFGHLVEPKLTTLECPWRDNAPYKSCIPVGEYLCEPHRSPKFGLCLAVKDVPGRSHILFHRGNFAGDVDCNLATDSHGCILVGDGRGKLGNRRGDLQVALKASHRGFAKFLSWVGNRPLTLVIADRTDEAA